MTHEEITNLIREWQHKLFLDAWDIKIEFHAKPATEDSNIVADCDAQNDYSSAKIRVYPKINKQDDEHIIQTLIHELIHCKVEEVHDLIRKAQSGKFIPEYLSDEAVERLTQWITMVVWRDK